MKVVIADTETDGFLDKLTKVWTVQVADLDDGIVTVYADQPGFPPLAEGIERIRAADRVVMHSGIGFDYWVIERFWPGALPREKLFDTLPAARLADPEERDHRLEAWGERLGIAKGQYTGDFQSFTPDLVTYAAQDVVVGLALYRHVMGKLDGWGESVQLEQDVAWALRLQEFNGFLLDVEGAQALAGELRQAIATIEVELRQIFKPMWVRKALPAKERYRDDWPSSWAPKRSSAKQGYTAGCPFTKVELQMFDPSSREQAGARLQRLGWRPKAFGKNGAPTVDETTLAALTFPEARALVRYYNEQKLLGMVADGKYSWLAMVHPDGRVRGRVNTNGAVTGRMSHSSPNMAQVSKDHRARRLWKARPGWVLVGCDAEGLEACELGHYLVRHDDGAFVERHLNGDKEVGTDTHSFNLTTLVKFGVLPEVALDHVKPSATKRFKTCFDAGRDNAKRHLYALMYGAGDRKLGSLAKEAYRDLGLPPIRKSNNDLGARGRLALSKAIKGIADLTEGVKAAAKSRGYIIGHDGRRLLVRSPHRALNTLLQGGGAVVMKKALTIFHFERAPLRGWVHSVNFGYCANVHDEVQIECPPELADAIGAEFADCIREAGVRLNLKCPMSGAFRVGATWAETH